MAKESLQTVQKKPVFRETFADEFSVRANGGVPTAVTFSQGKAFFVPSLAPTLTNNFYFYGTYTVRFKVKSTSFSAYQYLTDFRSSTGNGQGYIYLDLTTGVIQCSSSPTVYVNGVATTTFPINQDNDVIISGIRLENGTGSIKNYITTRYIGDLVLNGSMDLMEVYLGTLDSKEVQNLYLNDRYKALSPHGEVLGAELAVGTWTVNSGSPTINGQIVTLPNSGSASSVVIANYWTTGKYYKITATVTNYSGTNTVIMPYDGSNPANAAINFNGTFTYYYTPTATTSCYMFNRTTNGATIQVNSIREVISQALPILSVDAFDGVIRNRLSSNLLGNELRTGIWANNGTYPYSPFVTNGDDITSAISSGTAMCTQTGSFVTGHTYTISFDITVNSGTILFRLNDTYLSSGGDIDKTITTSGHYDLQFISTNKNYYGFRVSATANFSLSGLKVRESIPSIVNTATTVVRDGNVNVMQFNGSTSKLDCGTYNGLTGDLTICAWVKPRTMGKTNNGYILSNNKVGLQLTTPNRFYFTSDESAGVPSANNSFTLGNYYSVILIRKGDGKTTFFVNGTQSYTADQASGTPATGTTNITIGNMASAAKTWDGNIAQVQVYSGILSQQEISEKFSSERYNYGV